MSEGLGAVGSGNVFQSLCRCASPVSRPPPEVLFATGLCALFDAGLFFPNFNRICVNPCASVVQRRFLG